MKNPLEGLVARIFIKIRFLTISNNNTIYQGSTDGSVRDDLIRRPLKVKSQTENITWFSPETRRFWSVYPFYLLPFRHTICFSQNIYRKRLSLYFKYNLSLKFIRRREEIVIPYYFSRNTRSPPKGEGPRPAEICFKTSCLSERQNHN